MNISIKQKLSSCYTQCTVSDIHVCQATSKNYIITMTYMKENPRRVIVEAGLKTHP